MDRILSSPKQSHFQKVCTSVQISDLCSKIEVTHNTVQTLKKEKKHYIFSSKKDTLKGRACLNSLEEYEIFNLLDSTLNAVKVDINLQRQDRFYGIKNVEQIIDGKIVDLISKEEEILVIQFWRSNSQIYLNQLQQYQDFAVKYEQEWKNKVRFISISFDPTIEQTRKYLEQKNLDAFEHYFINTQQKQHHAEKLFHIDNQPKVVIINQNQEVEFEGNTNHIQLDEAVNKLISNSDLISQIAQEGDIRSQQEIRFNEEQDRFLTSDQFFDIIDYIELHMQKDLDKNVQIINQNNADIQLISKRQQVLRNGDLQVCYPLVDLIVSAPVKNKQEIFDKILNKHFEKYPVGKYINLISKDIDQKEDILNIQTIVSECLESAEIKQFEFTIHKQQQLVLLSSKKKFEFVDQIVLKQYQPLNSDVLNPEQIQNFQKKARQKLGLFLTQNQISPNIKVQLSSDIETTMVGKQFQNINNMMDIQGNITNIECPQGKNFIFYVWANWCKPSKIYLQELITYLKQSQNSSQLEVVAIDIESFQNNSFETVKQNKWDEHIKFYMNGLKQNQGFQSRQEYLNIGIKQVPFSLITDDKGIVQHVGHPKNLVGKIESIIQSQRKGLESEGEQFQKQQQRIRQKSHSHMLVNQFQTLYDNTKLTLKSINQNLEELNQCLQDIIKKIGYTPRIIIRNSRDSVIDYKLSFINKIYNQPELELEYVDKDWDIIYPLIYLIVKQVQNKEGQQKELLQQIKESSQSFETEQGFKVIKKVIETVNLQQILLQDGEKCQQCMSNIVPPYFYQFQSKKSYCYKCGTSQDNSKSDITSYNVPENLLFIPEKVEDFRIQIQRIGNNKQIAPGQELPQQNTTFECQTESDICNQKGPRYICMQCMPGPVQEGGFLDLCEGCFKSYNNPECDMHEEVIDFLQTECNHNEKHIFLKVLINNGNYYDY